MTIIAKVLLYDKNKNVLILRRSVTHPNFPHHADLPGGEVAIDEANSAGAIREIYEETRLTVLESSVNLIYNRIPRKNVTHILYTAEIQESEPKSILS